MRRFIDLLRSLIAGFVFCTIAACASEVRIGDRYSMEYLDAKLGKPLVYPAGVERPQQLFENSIPTQSSAFTDRYYDVNEVVKPPRIVTVPASPVKENKEDKEDSEEVIAETESGRHSKFWYSRRK